MNNSGTQVAGESGFSLLERGDQGAPNRIIHIISHKLYVGSARYFSKTNVSRLVAKMNFELLEVHYNRHLKIYKTAQDPYF